MRVASVNFYAANTQPFRDSYRLQEELKPDVIGFQELTRYFGLVRRRLRRYTIYTSRLDRTMASNEVAVAVRNDLRVTGWWAKNVSQVAPGQETRVFKNRWYTVVTFYYRRKRFAILNYHGNAAIQDGSGQVYKNRRVREYREAAVLIQREIKSLQSKGFNVLVTGDFNYRRYRVSNFVLWYYSPQRIFRRCGLRWVEHGIDYVAWPKHIRKKSSRVVSRFTTGSDHDWLIVDLDV